MPHKIPTLPTFLTLLTLLLLLPQSNQSPTTKTIEIPTKFNCTFEILQSDSEHEDIKNKKYATQLPTSLHVDLWKHSIIKDPYFSKNRLEQEWVENCTVLYEVTFQVRDSDGKIVELVVQGVDTYAIVVVNNVTVLNVNNLFRTYKVRIDHLLKNQANILQIKIFSHNVFEQKPLPPHPLPFSSAYTRRPDSNFLSLKFPEIRTIGINSPLYLNIYDEAKIQTAWIRNKIVNQDLAILNVAVQLSMTKIAQDIFDDMLEEQLWQGYKVQILVDDQKIKEVSVVKDYFYADIEIKQPQLWWPNGVGKPNLYNITINLIKDKNLVQSKQISYGIRTTKLIQQPNTFKLIINNYPIFIKGATVMPLDIFSKPDLPSSSNYTYSLLLKDTISTNMNTLRILGSGIYLPQSFYKQASENGIMIIQDFMFNDKNYPASATFFQNVQQQIKQQVRKIRNYPCIVLWIGNDDVLSSMHLRNMWEGKYWEDYSLLFQNLIPMVIQRECPSVPYIHGSPLFGDTYQYFQNGGDVHFMGLVNGTQNLENFNLVLGPFTSQIGISSMPSKQSLFKFLPIQQLSFTFPLLTHSKYSKGFKQLFSQIHQQFLQKQQSFYKKAYHSQLYQAYAVQLAITAHRIKKGKTSGLLYHHLNDAWPALSNSVIDYYGRWKAASYVIKKLYENVQIFVNQDNTVVVVNDFFEDVEVDVAVWVKDFDGNVIFQMLQNKIKIPSDKAFQIIKIDPKLTSNSNKTFIHTELVHQSKISTITKFFAPVKNLQLPDAILIVSYVLPNNSITLTSDKLIKNLHIYHAKKYICMSDNYFDIVPGNIINVQILGEELKSIISDLKFQSAKFGDLNVAIKIQEKSTQVKKQTPKQNKANQTKDKQGEKVQKEDKKLAQSKGVKENKVENKKIEQKKVEEKKEIVIQTKERKDQKIKTATDNKNEAKKDDVKVKEKQDEKQKEKVAKMESKTK